MKCITDIYKLTIKTLNNNAILMKYVKILLDKMENKQYVTEDMLNNREVLNPIINNAEREILSNCLRVGRPFWVAGRPFEAS